MISRATRETLDAAMASIEEKRAEEADEGIPDGTTAVYRWRDAHGVEHEGTLDTETLRAGKALARILRGAKRPTDDRQAD